MDENKLTVYLPKFVILQQTLSSFFRKYDVKSAFTLMLEQNFSYKIYCFCDDNLIVCKQSSTVQSNIGSIQMKRS